MPISKYDTVAQIEAKAVRVGDCLVRKSIGYARHTNILRHGPMPEGVCVCHTCDNPLCIEDSHHWRGTKQDNSIDAVQKGRSPGFRKGGVRFTGPHKRAAAEAIRDSLKEQWAPGGVRRV